MDPELDQNEGTAQPEGQVESPVVSDIELDGSGEGQQTNPNPGVQKRIDELTARAREAEAREKQWADRFATAFNQTVAVPQRQQEADPYAELEQENPALAKALRMQEAKTQRMLSQFQTQMAVQQETAKISQIASQYGVDAEVANRAQELGAMWASKGLPISADDAVTFALGEFAKKGGGAQAHQPRQPHRQPGGGRAPVVAPRTQRSPLPNNFADLSRDEQNLELKKRGINPDADMEI